MKHERHTLNCPLYEFRYVMDQFKNYNNTYQLICKLLTVTIMLNLWFQIDSFQNIIKISSLQRQTGWGKSM